MTDKMKMTIIFAVVGIVFLAQFFFTTSDEVSANTPISFLEEAEDDILKLRVIANSDDHFDQVVKRTIVLAISSFMNSQPNGYDTGFLVNNLSSVRESIETVLSEMDVEQEVEVSFGIHYFPAVESYHPSLVVRLGEARGENWWCFINPGVCVVPTADEVTTNSVQVQVREEVQETISVRTVSIVSSLFGNGTTREVVNGEVDWFSNN